MKDQLHIHTKRRSINHIKRPFWFYSKATIKFICSCDAS